MKYYTGSIEDLKNIEQQIRSNANLPNSKGTLRWAICLSDELAECAPLPTTTPGLFAIPVPVNGWGSFSYSEITNGITHPETLKQDVEILVEAES